MKRKKLLEIKMILETEDRMHFSSQIRHVKPLAS